MSGPGTNARRLLEQPDPRYEVRLLFTDNPASNAARIAAEFGVQYAELDIYRFCGAPHPGAGGGEAGGGPSRAEEARRGLRDGEYAMLRKGEYAMLRKGEYAALREGEYAMLRKGEYAALRDPERRAAFDRELAAVLRRRGTRLAALAGYDWVLGAELCRTFLFVNVHPGDLRVKDGSGRRLYVGLGWVPSAKAILNGERFVRASTHLVIPALDGGPIARVSRGVPVELPDGLSPERLLPPGVSLSQIIRDLRAGGKTYGGEPIVRIAQQAQERLKVEGDWVEFPRTVQKLSGLLLEGRLTQAPDGSAFLDGEPVGDLFLQPEGVP
jgi:folate-dependent phosphoribosylglycinamide formyltransferase PurN